VSTYQLHFFSAISLLCLLCLSLSLSLSRRIYIYQSIFSILYFGERDRETERQRENLFPRTFPNEEDPQKEKPKKQNKVLPLSFTAVPLFCIEIREKKEDFEEGKKRWEEE
jgi:hypothetical protein